MKQLHTKAIILRRINFGEADRILTVITLDKGKLSLIAKGVRKSKSKLAGGLELFSVTDLGYIDGRSDLKTVISSRLVRNYGNIVHDIDVTMMAYDFLKRIDTSTKESCEPDYFELLDGALAALNEDPDNVELVRVWFSVKLLVLSGLGINLDNQVNSKGFDESQRYNFSFDDMGFFAHGSGVYFPKHIKFLRLLAKVSKPSNLIKVADSNELAVDLNPLLNNCLQLHKP